MEKKGTIQDKMYLLFVFLAIICIACVYIMVWNPTYDALSEINNTAVNGVIENFTPAATTTWMDVVIVMLYFVLQIFVSIILPLRVYNSRLYFFIVFFFSLLYVPFVAYYANGVETFLTSLSISLPLTLLLIQYFVAVEVVFFLIMAFVLYYKGSNPVSYGGGGGYY